MEVLTELISGVSSHGIFSPFCYKAPRSLYFLPPQRGQPLSSMSLPIRKHSRRPSQHFPKEFRFSSPTLHCLMFSNTSPKALLTSYNEPSKLWLYFYLARSVRALYSVAFKYPLLIYMTCLKKTHLSEKLSNALFTSRKKPTLFRKSI